MGGAHSSPRRGGVARQLIEAGAKRERESAQPQEKGEASINGRVGETLRRADHPGCAASVASRHSFDGASSPPLRGGEYYATIITKHRTTLGGEFCCSTTMRQICECRCSI